MSFMKSLFAVCNNLKAINERSQNNPEERRKKMCGIFGFVLKNPVHTSLIFRVLQKLEVSQYPGEKKPVGGYGAGVAVLLPDGDVYSEKVGRVDGSPAAQLAKIVEPQLSNVQVLIGHVRYPNPEFMEAAKFKETAQPYVGQFESELTIVSAHNGKVENYKELKERMKEHAFESEKVGFVDSEIIPHYFSELINETESADEALYRLFCTLKGSNAVSILHLDAENAFLHLIHRGKTRGLTVWTNEKNEVIFCSRPEPVTQELETLLKRDKFKEKISIKWHEDAGVKLSFPVTFE
jgi:glucosamine 6-phosphate synthetase-like amidotransferase/phosphosugar isomerase protein